MGETKQLVKDEAVQMITKIAKDEIAMLCTFAAAHSLGARPMGTAGIDSDGTLWFMSSRDSEKNREIQANPKVHLLYSKPSKSEYMLIEGMASIVNDRWKIEELWSPLAKAWFTEGKSDPRITLLRVVPVRGHYWDTKHNRAVQLLEIAVGALVGKAFDDGVQGELRV